MNHGGHELFDVHEALSGTVGALTYLAMFSYEVQRDGSVKAPSIADIPNIAQSAGAANALVVSNLENFAFNADLAHAIFTDEAVQDRLFSNLIQIANEVGYKDIHFDFELLHPEDRELYNNFLRRARDRFHPAGLTLSTALAPKASDIRTGIYGAYDYAEHVAMAIPVAPALLTAILTDFMLFLTTFSAFKSPAPTTIAVPCWRVLVQLAIQNYHLC